MMHKVEKKIALFLGLIAEKALRPKTRWTNRAVWKKTFRVEKKSSPNFGSASGLRNRTVEIPVPDLRMRNCLEERICHTLW